MRDVVGFDFGGDAGGCEHSVSTFALSKRMGTSVQQIDRTYGRVLPDAADYERGLLDAFDSQLDTTEEAK